MSSVIMENTEYCQILQKCIIFHIFFLTLVVSHPVAFVCSSYG